MTFFYYIVIQVDSPKQKKTPNATVPDFLFSNKFSYTILIAQKL